MRLMLQARARGWAVRASLGARLGGRPLASHPSETLSTGTKATRDRWPNHLSNLTKAAVSTCPGDRVLPEAHLWAPVRLTSISPSFFSPRQKRHPIRTTERKPSQGDSWEVRPRAQRGPGRRHEEEDRALETLGYSG